MSNGKPFIGSIDVNKWMVQRDSTSVYMDPLFINPYNKDYRVKDRSVLKKIGFKEIKQLNAGVVWSKSLQKYKEHLTL